MKIKDEFVKLPKEMLYDMYLSLVYNPKDYDNITRTKMIDEIVKEYNQEGYLCAICTEKELKFLDYARNHKLNKKDLVKYDWEIKETNKKFIFSTVTFEIFEEQVKNVDEALLLYKNNPNRKTKNDELITFIITVVRINGELLTKALHSMITSMVNITDENFNALLGHPLIHFYCEFHSEQFDFSSDEEELISYRTYYEILYDLSELRKEYGISGCIKFDIRDYYDMYYYHFPIHNDKVKKMCDEIDKFYEKEFLYQLIDEARLLNYRDSLEFFFSDKRLLKIINEALDEIPCGVMNGFTPNDYAKQKILEKDLQKKFTRVTQVNAHLCKNAADEYYKLYFALLDYTNNKYHIEPSIKKIYKQEGLNATKLMPINDYLFTNKNIIDDFIKENPKKLSNEELAIINGFKKSVTSKFFFVVGFERDYTEILSEDGKIYMVKGIRDNLDRVLKNKELPIIMSTTLLMFKDNIVYNSFVSQYTISVGNDIKQQIINDYNKAIRYYHL